ncbi:MAG TPA: dTDP-4-dehydrorhamnose reductase [Casimicrobiaceae bacterium]
MAGPTILLIGAGGQLGHELAAVLPACGDVVAVDQPVLDLADPLSIARAVRETRPQFIVNAGAYTAVDRAESEREAAFAINGRGPGILADEAKRVAAVLIHYSTDYVFAGDRISPYDEAAPTAPLGVYGASKLEGERAIAASGAAALTLRTSWVYSRHGQNFLVTMQRLAATRDEIRVVADQHGVPNWSRALARATATLVARGPAYVAERAGLYHLSAQGHATWYEFARAIIGEARVRVVPITTAEYPTPARRPAHAVLDATRFARTFGFALPDWQTLLHECLAAPAEPPLAPAVH